MNTYQIRIKFVNPKFDVTIDLFTAFTQGDAIEKAKKAYSHEPIETIEATPYQN